MFCPNCGNNLPDNAQFCANCGSQMPNQQPVQAQQPSQNKLLQTLKGLSKKQIITIACAAVAVIVALFLIFFFACGGCDSATQKNIVNEYVEAIEKGDALAVAKLYHPTIIEEEGYDRSEYEEFVDNEDYCYYYNSGDAVKKSTVNVYSLEEYMNAQLDLMIEEYGDWYSKDEIAELKKEYLAEIDELEEELYGDLYEEYGIKATDIAIGCAEVEFKGGSDGTYTLALIKVDGKWYIGASTTGDLF